MFSLCFESCHHRREGNHRGGKDTSSSSQWIKKTTTDKVWLCESVGKLKGVGQLAKAKMNELRIHMIADIQLHVRHCGKVPIRGFGQIYVMALQALPGNPPSSFKDHRKAKIRIIVDMERDGWRN